MRLSSSQLLAAVMLLALTLPAYAAGSPPPISYMRIYRVTDGGKLSEDWIPIDSYKLEIPIPSGTRGLYLVLDQLAPYVFKDVLTEDGVKLAVERGMSQGSFFTPKYCYINASAIKGSLLIELEKADPSSPFIELITLGGQRRQLKITIPPGGKYVLETVDLEGGQYAVDLTFIASPGDVVVVNATPACLVYARPIEVPVPGLGKIRLVERRYVAYGGRVELVNTAAFKVNVVLEASFVYHRELEYSFTDNIFTMDTGWTPGGSVRRIVVMNLPEAFTILKVEGGKVSGLDPVLGSPLPPGIEAVEVMRPTLQVFVNVGKVTLEVSSSDGFKVYDGQIRITWPNGEQTYVPPGGSVTPLALSLQAEVVFGGGAVAGYNVCSLPPVISLQAEFSTLRVHVFDLEGNPLPNASVLLYSYLTYSYKHVLTGTDGTAVFKGLPKGYNYMVIIYFRGAEVFRQHIRLDRSRVVTAYCSVKRSTVVLERMKGGKVVNATVKVYSQALNITSKSDENGIAELGLLPLGRYRVEISRNNMVIYKGELTLGGDVRVKLPVSTLKIAVKDLLGNGVGGVTLVLYIGNNTEFKVKTGDEGYAVLRDVPYGSYELTVSLGTASEQLEINIPEDSFVSVKLGLVVLPGGLAITYMDGVIATVIMLILSLLLLHRLGKDETDIVE